MTGIGTDSLVISRVGNGFFVRIWDERRQLQEELVADAIYGLTDIVRAWADKAEGEDDSD
jgi:hypothetical protein